MLVFFKKSFNRTMKCVLVFVCVTGIFTIFIFLQDKYIGYISGWEYEYAISVPEDERAQVLSIKKFIYNFYRAKKGDGNASYNLAMYYIMEKDDIYKAIFWLQHGYDSDCNIKCLKGLILTNGFIINNSISNQKKYILDLSKSAFLSTDFNYLHSTLETYMWEIKNVEQIYKDILVELEK